MNYQKIQRKFEPIAKKDPIEGLLAVEKDLGRIPVVRGNKWGNGFFSELPTSSVPKNVKNAETINAILVKSYETQGSTLVWSDRQWFINVLFQDHQHRRQYGTDCWIVTPN